MANTIGDLYAKYTSQVGETLEEDRYFQYLFEMVQAGDNTLQQKNRILHKVVDEQWLTVVEQGIESIFNIVDKPRRFIATAEEVVPVALAKKITADSVRHLSQNTQFIASDEHGDIQPTHILNVTTEESYDLYENRFVYHLIQRLFAFVDKRTDVIFWSTGDETCNTMSMESKIDDAYEEISYKIEMTIKNRQSFVENDSDNMDVFKRIDRVRRMARTLRTSPFCDIMNGCSKVHSPIQRTNLMMKDPDYRTCYKLWQFIESYDEVGYTIEEQDSALEFDEEYLLQMYTNLITNYTVFKSLLESDPRKMSEIATKHPEPVKPKFIKEIKEEIVDDYNIPDVEVRKVIIEEVTQAQLDAEAALEQEKAHSRDLEDEKSQLEDSLNDLQWQMQSLMDQLDALEDEKSQLEAQKTTLEIQLEDSMENLKEAQSAQEEIRKALKEAEEREIEAEARIASEKKRVEQLEKNEQLARVEADRLVSAARAEAEEKVRQAKSQAAKELAAARNKARTDISDTQKKADQAVRAAQLDAKNKVDSAQKKAQRDVERIKKQSQESLDEVKKQLDAALSEKDKALAKMQSNTLSHYIVNALQERRDRKAKEDDK